MFPLPIPTRHSPATTGIILLQSKSETEHDRCPNSKDHEGIDVRQTRPLVLHGSEDLGESPVVRLIRAQSRVGKALGKALRRILEIRIVRPGVLDKPCLMDLETPYNQGGD